jgi:hypothetical protein
VDLACLDWCDCTPCTCIAPLETAAAAIQATLIAYGGRRNGFDKVSLGLTLGVVVAETATMGIASSF